MNNNKTLRCSSQIDWKQIDENSLEEQMEFLTQWKDKFDVQLVSSSEKNVKKGDHLAVERYKILPGRNPLYAHHAICTTVKRDTVTLAEYGGNISGLLDVPSSGFSCLAKIQFKEYKLATLEEEMVYKVVWPKELKRYGRKEVSKRAKKRKDEQLYHPLKNNCEHFATWCKCGLNVSLQARFWCLWARQIVDNRMFIGGRETIANIVPVLLRVLANVPNDSVVAFVGKSFSKSLFEVLVDQSFIDKAVIRVIKETFDKWTIGDFSDDIVHERLVQIIKKAVCRFVEASRCRVGSVAFSVYQSIKKTLISDSTGDCVDGFTDVVDGADNEELFNEFVDGTDNEELFNEFVDQGAHDEELFNEFLEWCKDENA